MRFAPLQTPEKYDAWAEHLREVFQTLEISSGTLADNISASVAAYCRQFHPQGVQRADLLLLVARAFCSVNDQASAERVLRSMQPHALHVSRWIEILSELHHFPDLLPYFSLGIIRPAEWAGAQLDRMWTIDFDRITLGDAERHEMMIHRSIRSLIEHVAIFWDATSGVGVLGLKGLDALRVNATGAPKQARSEMDELLEFIAHLFVQQQNRRQWCAVPTLMKLG